MTKKEVVKMSGLLSVVLVCMSIAWANSNTTVGTSVPVSVADELRSGACNQTFKYDNVNPIYCAGGSCATQMPNERVVGQGTSGSAEYQCGASASCNTYIAEADCAW
jgi:hypothetical protein